jgi:hypothetical protein
MFIGLDSRINGIMWSKVLTSGNYVGSAKISLNSSKKASTTSSYLVIVGSLYDSIKKTYL